jgi:hypothetical protein
LVGAFGKCLNQGRPLVHDVFLAKYRHSDWALGPGHARDLWLPYLWGLSPREFNEFTECCRDAAYARQEKFWQGLDAAEGRLREQPWSWTQLRPLETFLAAEIESRAQRSDRTIAEILRRDRADIVRDAFTFTYVIVAEAYEESSNLEAESTPERDQALVALHPPRAIARALDEAVGRRLES